GTAPCSTGELQSHSAIEDPSLLSAAVRQCRWKSIPCPCRAHTERYARDRAGFPESATAARRTRQPQPALPEAHGWRAQCCAAVWSRNCGKLAVKRRSIEG